MLNIVLDVLMEMRMLCLEDNLMNNPLLQLSPDFFRSVQYLDGQFSSFVSNINQSTFPEEEVIRSWSRFHQ